MRKGVTPWDPWYRRALAAVGILRTATPDELDLGADYGEDQSNSPAFDPKASAAAMSMFPWPYAATTTRAADLSGRKIRVYRKDGDNRVYLPDHWLPKLLAKPNPDDTGELFRRQIYCDLQPGGNAYIEIVGRIVSDRQIAIPVNLERLSPERVKAVTNQAGVTGYEYDDQKGGRFIEEQQMLHIRLPSFLKGPKETPFGTGYVRPMTEDYNAEQAARQRTTAIASRGRPDVLISPKGDAVWNNEQRKAVTQRYEDMTTGKKGGVIAASGHAKIDILSWGVDQMQLPELREHNRTTTLAATRTPPVIMGLETANFATAREQKIVYWGSLHSDARLIDASFTSLLRATGEMDTYAEHDFSDVPELMLWQSDAINRANSLASMGVPLDVALRSQGLDHIAEQIPAAFAGLEEVA